MPTYTENYVNYSYTVGNSDATVIRSPDASGTVTILGSFIVDSVTYNVTRIVGIAFQDCSSLTSVTIPSSITSIGEEAFFSCSGLTSVTIPSSVTSMGNYVFSRCTGLTNIIVNTYLSNIGLVFFSLNNQGLHITFDYIGEIPDGTCNGRSKMTSVTIGPNITRIGEEAFQNCSSLTSVTIPSSITSIGNYAFQNCSSLTSITIPNSVTSIGNYAFFGCTGLTNIIVNAYLANFGVVFSVNNQGLHITFDYIGEIPDGTCNGLSKMTSVTIGPNITRIGNSAFQNCSGLTSVTIPSSVTSIGNSAFQDCSSLTSVTIPSSITSIGNYAFLGCSDLTSVIIPSSVTSIDNSAFQNCSSLTSVTIPSSIILNPGVFSGCSGLITIGQGSNFNINITGNIETITYSFSISQNNNDILNGVINVYENLNLINYFYNSNNIGTNILAHTTNDYGADYMFINQQFTNYGTTIPSIPALDSQYGAQEWMLWGNGNGTSIFLSYKNSANQWVDLPDPFIFKINSIDPPLPAAPVITNITSTGGVTSISFQNPVDTSIRNYAYSTINVADIHNFVLPPFSSYKFLSPAKTTSPLTINGLHGVVQIKIKAFNGSYFNGSYSDESTPVENWYEPPFV